MRIVASFLAVGLLGLWALAGAVYTNDTGQVARGFEIEFAAPVMITSHAPAFPEQAPLGKAKKFTFSGGEVAPGGSFWLSWQPSSVKVTSYQWLTEALSQPPSGPAAEGSSEQRPQQGTSPQVQGHLKTKEYQIQFADAAGNTIAAKLIRTKSWEEIPKWNTIWTYLRNTKLLLW